MDWPAASVPWSQERQRGTVGLFKSKAQKFVEYKVYTDCARHGRLSFAMFVEKIMMSEDMVKRIVSEGCWRRLQNQLVCKEYLTPRSQRESHA